MDTIYIVVKFDKVNPNLYTVENVYEDPSDAMAFIENWAKKKPDDQLGIHIWDVEKHQEKEMDIERV